MWKYFFRIYGHDFMLSFYVLWEFQLMMTKNEVSQLYCLPTAHTLQSIDGVQPFHFFRCPPVMTAVSNPAHLLAACFKGPPFPYKQLP